MTYTVGRESNAQYGETLNGVQKKLNLYNHRFLQPVDPYVVPGDPSSGLLPGVHGDDPGRGRAGGSSCSGVLLSHVHVERAGEPRAVSQAGGLRRASLRIVVSHLSRRAICGFR